MRTSAKLPFERISPPCIPQHQTGAAGAPDAVAKVIGLGAGIGADPDLIKRSRAAAAKQSAKQHWIMIADHATQPGHRARIHRHRNIAVETGRELDTPRPVGPELHMLLELADKVIRRAFEK